jgi:hypothetical protein
VYARPRTTRTLGFQVLFRSGHGFIIYLRRNEFMYRISIAHYQREDWITGGFSYRWLKKADVTSAQMKYKRRLLDVKRVKPTRCYTMVYWTLWFAQHVSGIIMLIIRSLRLYRWPQRVAPHLGYGRLLVSCMAVGLSVRVEGCCTICPSSGACDYTDGPSDWHLTLVVAGCCSGAWL